MDILKLFKEAEERERKAIPSKIFYNHFYAIKHHISNCTNKFDFKTLDFYNRLTIRNDQFDINYCKQLLWNSWSTEIAFNMKSSFNDKQFYKYALHWHFPQAYYSVYLAMTAFHETLGVANDQHEKSIKVFGNSLKDGHYPDTISFYTEGGHNSFTYYGLPEFTGFGEFSPLAHITNEKEAQTQIANFLKSTREKNAKHKRKRAVGSLKKDKRFQTNKGEFVKRFTKKHWDILYSSFPQTSLLNIMYRLRIKANYHDIETFMNADIDFEEFHKSLSIIVSYLNLVHETYVCKAIGANEYEQILTQFNTDLSGFKAGRRYSKIISSI